MKHWFYCYQCKRWLYVEIQTVQNCPRCGDVMGITMEAKNDGGN